MLHALEFGVVLAIGVTAVFFPRRLQQLALVALAADKTKANSSMTSFVASTFYRTVIVLWGIASFVLAYLLLRAW